MMIRNARNIYGYVFRAFDNFLLGVTRSVDQKCETLADGKMHLSEDPSFAHRQNRT